MLQNDSYEGSAGPVWSSPTGGLTRETELLRQSMENDRLATVRDQRAKQESLQELSRLLDERAASLKDSFAATFKEQLQGVLAAQSVTTDSLVDLVGQLMILAERLGKVETDIMTLRGEVNNYKQHIPPDRPTGRDYRHVVVV